ncbi:MAG: Peptide transporter permease [Fibrobacteres bacterium]|nr:Peptide transporter permease [Fibrobacterota bacterium]
MINFILRRLLYTIPIMLGISLIVFVLFHVAGGNPVYRMLGKNASPAEILRLTHQLGLDRPLWVQYLHYLADLLRFDFGRSWETRQRISEMIATGLFPSLCLAVPSFILTTLLAVAVAMVSALFKGKAVDKLLVVGSVLGMSISILALIIGAQYLLAYRMNLFPISGFEIGWRGLPYLALPVLLWIANQVGGDVRYYRSVLLEEIGREYVVTARAKGLSRGRAMRTHVLRNAMIPIVTRLVMEVPLLFTGSLLLENFFGIPGLGNMSINALNASDFPVIEAVTLFGSILYILANLVGDVLYAVFDPRVKLS